MSTATPSGNSATAGLLLSLSTRLRADTGEVSGEKREQADDYLEKALNIVSTSGTMIEYPLYHGSMLSVLDTLLSTGLPEK